MKVGEEEQVGLCRRIRKNINLPQSKIAMSQRTPKLLFGISEQKVEKFRNARQDVPIWTDWVLSVRSYPFWADLRRVDSHWG
jgi:hypothetical protein